MERTYESNFDDLCSGRRYSVGIVRDHSLLGQGISSGWCRLKRSNAAFSGVCDRLRGKYPNEPV